MKRVLLVGLLVVASTARADDDPRPSYRAVVDRVELEPASITGFRLRVYLSALAIGGQLLDLTEPKSIKLYLGASEKKLPYALGTYDMKASETAIVFVVQTTADFGEVLPAITDALDRDLLASLGDRTQIAVVTYGDSVGTGKLAGIKTARGKLALATDGTAGDPALLDALDRALMELRKMPGADVRKLVVVIGDGRDRGGDKDRVTRAGTRAAKDGIRIHALGFSASDARRPMLALGELTKRSLGTFRWVRKPTPDSWSEAFKQLRDEITKQYVVTYFVGADDEVAGKKLHVVTVGRTEATSNELKVPATPTCAGEVCETGYCAGTCVSPRPATGRGVVGWVLVIGGVGLGVIVMLGVIGFVITKRQQAPVVPGVATARPQPAPTAVAPGLLPNGRPIPALLVVSGPRTGQRIALKHGFLIGKQPGCDLVIEDGYTSSQHAQIGMDPQGNCRLVDRGSTNGTFLDGARISDQVLVHGATIKIGSIELRFLAQ